MGDQLVVSLIEACHSEDLKALNRLAKKISLDTVVWCDMTPLQWSIMQGAERSVLRLLILGADINGRNNKGETPLHVACSMNFCVKLLVDRGCDLESLDYQGNSPLHVACFMGHQNLVKYLLNLGVSVRQNKKGKTPFDLGKEEGFSFEK